MDVEEKYTESKAPKIEVKDSDIKLEKTKDWSVMKHRLERLKLKQKKREQDQKKKSVTKKI